MLKRSGGSKFGRLYVKPEVVGLVAVVISGLSDLQIRQGWAGPFSAAGEHRLGDGP